MSCITLMLVGYSLVVTILCIYIFFRFIEIKSDFGNFINGFNIQVRTCNTVAKFLIRCSDSDAIPKELKEHFIELGNELRRDNFYLKR